MKLKVSKISWISLLVILTYNPFALAIDDKCDDSIDQPFTIIQSFYELVEEIELTNTQKSKLVWVLYQHTPTLLADASSMLKNRQRFLLDSQQQYPLSNHLIETHALAQGKLLTQLIIGKELLKRDLIAVLEPHQLAMIRELASQLLLSCKGKS
ncbi:MAG: hypothetical protein KDI92_10850 [Xanthomonadales bacterium]|nr:hypothetical protein [Xanthomonadales bacterium]